ncbi:hypothetical protein [Segniliparus rugosus]|uniref:hypothetical protein n=1 Tax=Segniliparus rugosus TaxID=286804 RepID=UPI000591409F|nr:hypothetical protein [Segniliparus rugosus]
MTVEVTVAVVGRGRQLVVAVVRADVAVKWEDLGKSERLTDDIPVAARPIMQQSASAATPEATRYHFAFDMERSRLECRGQVRAELRQNVPSRFLALHRSSIFFSCRDFSPVG